MVWLVGAGLDIRGDGWLKNTRCLHMNEIQRL